MNPETEDAQRLKFEIADQFSEVPIVLLEDIAMLEEITIAYLKEKGYRDFTYHHREPGHFRLYFRDDNKAFMVLVTVTFVPFGKSVIVNDWGDLYKNKQFPGEKVDA